MTCNWDTTRQRILRQDRTETAILYLTALVAASTAILILAFGDSHPDATKIIGGAAITILLQASIAGMFPARARRAFRALAAPTAQRTRSSSRAHTRYAYSPARGER